MTKVSVIFVFYNSKRFVEPVVASVINQTHKDIEIIAVINSDDGTKELLKEKFPSVKIIYPGTNLGFAGGNNLGIDQSDGEFVQLVNPDLILAPDYIEKMLRVFNDPKVGAATGKLLRYDFDNNQKTNIIDSTGIVISNSGRARDRGQLEVDKGQYDNQTEIFGVSGAGPMYRRSALEAVRYCENGRCEYFDESFVAYWEDVDLSWRLNRVNYKNVYVPNAVAYHGRSAGQSQGGYLHVFHYIKHHSKLSPTIRRLNYKNHILMYLKNAPYIHPAFILREIVMLGYITVLETSTLKVIPELIRLIPRILKKRRALQAK
ncbi:MAG TPA: glycosyltransferase family 2 protein [Verrucomicrobiae bacterium]|nr:glycosyltransferase family 2 protein [Verrucomicrobiae bacterium]